MSERRRETLRRTPELQDALLRAQKELCAAEERLSLFRRHGHRLDATIAQEDEVERLRAELARLRRVRAA